MYSSSPITFVWCLSNDGSGINSWYWYHSSFLLEESNYYQSSLILSIVWMVCFWCLLHILEQFLPFHLCLYCCWLWVWLHFICPFLFLPSSWFLLHLCYIECFFFIGSFFVVIPLPAEVFKFGFQFEFIFGFIFNYFFIGTSLITTSSSFMDSKSIFFLPSLALWLFCFDNILGSFCLSSNSE